MVLNETRVYEEVVEFFLRLNEALVVSCLGLPGSSILRARRS